MDHGSLPAAVTPCLYGVKKTLRRLYAPSIAPNAAIEQALAVLAQLECRSQRLDLDAAILAPAA